ncbi:MAG TPA: glycosyltransferase family 39 protein [Patescibacteria group bacterium]|nr:glycosyltransferase family 39 protein [Patescibacteria group bacterium]
MIKKYLPFLIFSLAILLAFITRFYLLGKAPAGLYLDEAGQGYSAYSILKTGKDEFGRSFPIVFRSFTDFKTPVYIYLIVPLIPIFGLTTFTVRFPSFFFSMLTFPVLYLLLEELIPQKEKKTHFLLSSITCLLLAISPWHILFGRTNFECNVALFFFLTGCLFFYLAIGKTSSAYKSHRPKLLILSALFFAIALPAYHAQRIVTPLMILILIIRFRKTLFSKKYFKYIIIAGTIGFIITLPTLSIATTPGFLARAGGLNIFTVKESAGFIENYKGPFGFIINSKIFLSLQEFGSLYVSYFSPREMFILGDSGPRSSFPELATFFVWQFPFYIYGLYLIVKKKELKELRFFVISFLLIAPIPAALTRDPYSTIRSLQMVIPLNILIALSIVEIYNKISKACGTSSVKNKNYKFIFWLTFIFVIIYSLLKLYSSVIILNEHYRGEDWDYGWQQATNIIKTFTSQSDGYSQNLPIVVDNSRNEPYIQLAFFLKADPVIYQKENFEVPLNEYYTNMTRNKNKIIEVPNGNKITTRPIDWQHDLLVKQYLIGDELAISLQQIKEHNLTLIKQINYPDGDVDLRIVETNPKTLKH